MLDLLNNTSINGNAQMLIFINRKLFILLNVIYLNVNNNKTEIIVYNNNIYQILWNNHIINLIFLLLL